MQPFFTDSNPNQGFAFFIFPHCVQKKLKRNFKQRTKYIKKLNLPKSIMNVTINFNIQSAKDELNNLTSELPVLNTTTMANSSIATFVNPIVSYEDVPLCKTVSENIIDLTNDKSNVIVIDNNEIEQKTIDPEIVSNDRFYKESTNTERVKKGFKGKIHTHQTNDDGCKQCPYCDFTTPKSNTLSMHLTRIHPEESRRDISPHVCKYCNKGFQASTNLAHHIKNHHEITYHRCPIEGCSYANAKNTTTLAGHISSKHLKHCYQDDTCLTCNTKIGSSIKYHVAFCSKESPLCRIIQ